MSRKETTFLTKEDLETLTTKRLLAYKKTLYYGASWGHIDDAYIECECSSCIDKTISVRKHKLQIEIVKSILKTREHVK